MEEIQVFDANLQRLYQEVLWNYVHVSKLSSFNVEPILPDLGYRGVINDEEYSLITRQHANVDKLLVLFKQIMPTKAMRYHRTLINVLHQHHQTALAKLLSEKLHEFNHSPKISFTHSHSNPKIDSVITEQKLMDALNSVNLNEELTVDLHRKLSTRDFENERYLSQGACAKVFEATCVINQRHVAIKKMNATLNQEDSWMKEVQILRKANHPHILSILGIVENMDMEEIWIDTEMMNSGSLRAYCTGKKHQELSSDQKMEISAHCWSALAYLHDVARITHKDIKPENILLHKSPDGSLTAKLCDFGLAEIKSTLTITEVTKIGGTWMYFAPEFSESKRNPRKADVYSLGATIIELLTNLHFWHNPENGQRYEDGQILFKLVTVYQNVTNSNTGSEVQFGPGASALDRCASCPDSVKDILRKSVAFDRHERPEASEVLHKFEKAKQVFTNLKKSSAGVIIVKQ